MKSPEWKPGVTVLNEKWEARKPRLFPREYFELQFEFAKALQEKTGDNLFDIIKTRTSSLRFGLFVYEGYVCKGEKPGVSALSEEALTDFAYADYLKTDGEQEPAEYHPKESTRFGCFYYDKNDKDDSLRIHFVNAENDQTGPLDKDKINERKREIKDLLLDIKQQYPDKKEISGLSWLYNLEAYTRLFPDTYTAALRENKDQFQWARGTTIWGQFLDNKMELKKDMVQELLRRVRNLEPGEELGAVFAEGAPLMSPLETRGRLQDFYEMYGV